MAAPELQQLQMEYVILVNKYEEELKKRPEIINKLDYTRKTFDELAKLAQKCMAQSDRAKADLDTLLKVYAAADATVCSLNQQYVTIMEQAKSRNKEMLDELKEKSEQLEKLNQKYYYSQAQSCMLQSQLEAARSNYNELSASTEDTKNKLEAANKETTSICENFKSNLVMIKNENEALTRDLDAKQKLLNLCTETLELYKQRVIDDGFKLDQITLELNKTNEESKNKNIIIEQLETEIRTLSAPLSETQNGFQNYCREEIEEKLKSLAETIEAKCNEIEVHSSAATEANQQLQAEKKERLKLAVELQNITASLEERGRELEVKTSALIEEKEARAKIESDFFQLEAGMRAKEEEHSRELADFLKKKTELEREKNALHDYINGLEQRMVEVASKTQPPIFQPEPDDNAVDWDLSKQGQNSKTEEDAMMDTDFDFFSVKSCDSLTGQPLPKAATETRYFAWASQMRSSREASPTPAAIQRVRDAPFTAADQLTSSVDELPILTKTSKQARPETPPMGRAAGRNDAAAAPTEKRYFEWASQMRSSREASPTPAAIQRVRDAPFTALQAQSQADQLALSAATRAKLPTPAKRARPGTPASNAATAGSKTTIKEWRFFKSKDPRNRNKKK